jgi:hypothetical protein
MAMGKILFIYGNNKNFSAPFILAYRFIAAHTITKDLIMPLVQTHYKYRRAGESQSYQLKL